MVRRGDARHVRALDGARRRAARGRRPVLCDARQRRPARCRRRDRTGRQGRGVRRADRRVRRPRDGFARVCQPHAFRLAARARRGRALPPRRGAGRLGCERPDRAIFNLHVPPYDSQLDMRPGARLRSEGPVSGRAASDGAVRLDRGSRADRALPADACRCTDMCTSPGARRTSDARCASTRAATTTPVASRACSYTCARPRRITSSWWGE